MIYLSCFRYYDRHSLNIHERKHTGVKPWKCLECGKRFIDSRLLNSHLKTHSDIKPYACDMCDKSYVFVILMFEYSQVFHIFFILFIGFVTNPRSQLINEFIPVKSLMSVQCAEMHLCNRLICRFICAHILVWNISLLINN